jgi:2-dehydro-3-deoxyphosphogluconate aldolase/(4S)-4-hydroxy-2-oxoglutarate aldolase
MASRHREDSEIMETAPRPDGTRGWPSIITGPIVPVLVVEHVATAQPLGAALLRGGITCAEVTLRTPNALGVIRSMAENPDLVVGAGTVVDEDQVEDAARAGARFIVSPGLSAAVVARAQLLSLPVIPGVVTATEVMRALDLNLTLLKFFPASTSGGSDAVKALGGPFPTVRFIPTGGIGPRDAHLYLSLPNVAAIGGSWIASPDLLAAGNFDAITERAGHATSIAAAARP